MSNHTNAPATATKGTKESKMGSKESKEEAPKIAPKNEVVMLARAKITVDPKVNARGFGKPIDTKGATFVELVAAIRDSGLLEPVVVRKHDNGSFSLIAGFRRIAACDVVGLDTIPATVRAGTDMDVLVDGLFENVQRDDLTAAELAYACVAVKTTAKKAGTKLSNEEIAGKLHKSRSHIGNLIRVVENCPEVVLKAFRGESGIALKLEQAILIAGKTDKDGNPDRDAQMEEWEKILERAKKSTRGEEDADGDSASAEGEKPPRMPRREKIEKLFDALGAKDLEAILVGGSWVEKPSDETKKALKSCLRWVLNSAAKYPVKMVEPEEEEEEEGDE